MTSAVSAADRQHMVDRAADLWNDLREARIFITGGTGFVGTWLLEALTAANSAYRLGVRAVVLTRDRARFASRAPHLADDPCLAYVDGDAGSFPYPTGSFDFAVHAATERWFEPDRERPLGILQHDFTATCRVLDFAAARGVRKLLFTSSGAVYGPGSASLDSIPEEYPGAADPVAPGSGYSVSKWLSEFACASYGRAFGFDAVVGRLFAFVGAYLPLGEGYAIGNFIRDALEKRPIEIKGDGTAIRSYLYGADLAVWLWSLLLRGTGGRVYNVGSPHGVSIRELAEVVVGSTSEAIPIHVLGHADAGRAPSRYVPNVTRAEEELGLRVWIPLDEAVRRTYEFHRAAR